MFKRIKVVTILIIVLLTLGISQFLTGALSMRALVNDREGFQASQRTNQSVAAFTCSGQLILATALDCM
ncbi:Tar ligand binding domain-containing protein [Symbiopectobacterium sp. Eva_TO]